MLLLTSLAASIVGFFVYFQVMQYRGRLAHPTVMRISMINCMALAFVFAMFVELTTESKDLSVIVTLLGVCTPTIWILRPRTLLDAVEVAIGSQIGRAHV